MDIYTITREDMGSGWQEILGDRQLVECIVANFGLADAMICKMTFHDKTELEYEIGHGECLRPYIEIYKGTDSEEASEVWLEYINRLSK